MKLVAAAISASLMVASPSLAETIALPDAGWKAAWAFLDTCLKARLDGVDAAITAILARPGVVEGKSLPAYGGGRPMRTFVGGNTEYLIRYGKKKKFGCFVAFSGNEELAASARQAIASFSGLQAKVLKPSKRVFFEWTISGSKDEIRLTPKSELGSILINLEVL